jgi:hypothetical protein
MQAQLVLAKVLLVQDNAAAAEALLRPAHTRAKSQSRHSPLVTLLEVEALWCDIQSRLADKRSTGARRWLEAPFGVLLHSTRSSNSGSRSWNDRTNSGSASGSGSGNNLVNTVGGTSRSGAGSRAKALPRFATIASARDSSSRPGVVWGGSGSSGSSSAVQHQQQQQQHSRRTSWLSKWHTYRGKRSASSPDAGSGLTATTAGDSAEELEITSQQLRGPHAPRAAYRRRKSDTDAIELQRHAEAAMSAARGSAAGTGYYEHGADDACSSENEFSYLGEGDARSQLYPAITDTRKLVSDSGIMRFR